MNKAIANTFGLNVEAQSYFELDPSSPIDQLPSQFIVVGEGSNLVFLDESIDISLLKVNNQHYKVEEFEDHYLVQLGAGLNWHNTVARLLDDGIAGLENLALIPGTVGAAPVQNIGAYGVEFSDFCLNVAGINIKTLQREVIAAQDCLFAYRDSIFKQTLKHEFIIEQVELKIKKHWQAKLNYGPLQALAKSVDAPAVFEQVCSIRRSKLPDPQELGNAGSFFKNPLISQQQANELKKRLSDLPIYPQKNCDFVKIPAAFLIDSAGLKGYKLGKAGVHQHQPLVLVNLGGSKAQDIINLAKYVVSKVNDMFAVKLEPEVRFVSAKGEVPAKDVI